MAVCGRPRVATSYMLVGLFRRICTVLWKLAGREGSSPPFAVMPSKRIVSVKGFFCGAFRNVARGPSPTPSTPWHCAQTRSNTLRPSATEGIRGRPCSLATIGAISSDTSGRGRMDGRTPTVGWQATRMNIPTIRRTTAGKIRMRVPLRVPPPPRIDDEGRPLDAPVGAPELLLLLPHAVGFGHSVVRVGQQDERQIVLLRELRVRGRTVGAEADDYRVPLGVGGVVVAEAARLRGAARGVVFGIEVEDDPLPPEVAQPHSAAGGILQGEVGRWTAFFHHHDPPSNTGLRPCFQHSRHQILHRVQPVQEIRVPAVDCRVGGSRDVAQYLKE